MPVRIAMVDLGAVWGGQEIYSASLMAAMRAAGHEVTSFSYLDRFAELPGRRHAVSIDYAAFPSLASTLGQRQADFDLVHFNGNRALYLSRFVHKHRPFVGTKHLPYAIDASPIKRRAGVALSPLLFGKIDAMISVCRATRAELPVSLRSRTSVIPNGVPRCHDPSVERNEAFTLVYVARLSRTKGIMDALEAVDKLSRSGMKLRFIVAGEGEMSSAAREYVSRHRLSDIVQFLGFTSEIAPLYSAAHACILPSSHEGMPLNLLEAFSAGCPVIAYDIPGVDEVVEEGKNGILVRNGVAGLVSALQALIEDSHLQARLARGAQESYERSYQLEYMVERTLSVYASVLDR